MRLAMDVGDEVDAPRQREDLGVDRRHLQPPGLGRLGEAELFVDDVALLRRHLIDARRELRDVLGVQRAQLDRRQLQLLPDRRQRRCSFLLVLDRRRHLGAPGFLAVGARVELRRVLAEGHDAGRGRQLCGAAGLVGVHFCFSWIQCWCAGKRCC